MSHNSGSEFFSNFEGFLKRFKLTTENDKDQEIFTLANLDSGYIRKFIVKKVDESSLFRRSSQKSFKDDSKKSSRNSSLKKKEKKQKKNERRSSNASLKNALGFRRKSLSYLTPGGIKRSKSEATLNRSVSNGSINSSKSEGGGGGSASFKKKKKKKKKIALNGSESNGGPTFKLGWNSSDSESDDPEILSAMTAKDREDKDDPPGYRNHAFVKEDFEDEGIGGLGKEEKEDEKERSDGDGSSETESLSSIGTSSPIGSPRFNLKMSPKPRRKSRKSLQEGQHSPVSLRSGYQSNRSSISSARKGILKKSTSTMTINMEMGSLSRPQTPTDFDDDAISNGEPTRLVRTATLNRVKFILDSGKPDNITGDYDDIKMEKGELRERNDRGGKLQDKENDDRGLSKSGRKCLVFSAGVLIVTMAVILGSFFGSRKSGRNSLVYKNEIENALEGRFNIIYDQFNSALLNFDSKEFKEMSSKLEKTMIKVIFLEESVNQPNSTIKLKIIKYGKSGRTLFRIKWEGQMTLQLPAIRKRVLAHLNQYGVFGIYKIEKGSFQIKELKDLCDALKCSHICELSERTLRFSCSCPDSLTLVNDTSCASISRTTKKPHPLVPLLINDDVSKALAFANAKIVSIISIDKVTKESQVDTAAAKDDILKKKTPTDDESSKNAASVVEKIKNATEVEDQSTTVNTTKLIVSSSSEFPMATSDKPTTKLIVSSSSESPMATSDKPTSKLIVSSSSESPVATSDKPNAELNMTISKNATQVTHKNDTVVEEDKILKDSVSEDPSNVVNIRNVTTPFSIDSTNKTVDKKFWNATEDILIIIIGNNTAVVSPPYKVSISAKNDTKPSITSDQKYLLENSSGIANQTKLAIEINVNVSTTVTPTTDEVHQIEKNNSTEAATLAPEMFNTIDTTVNEVGQNKDKVSKNGKEKTSDDDDKNLIINYVLGKNGTTSTSAISSEVVTTEIPPTTTKKIVTIQLTSEFSTKIFANSSVDKVVTNDSSIIVSFPNNSTSINATLTTSPNSTLHISEEKSNVQIDFDVIANASHDLSIQLPSSLAKNESVSLPSTNHTVTTIAPTNTSAISIREFKCAENEFSCLKGESLYGNCTPVMSRCDSVLDCYDKSDEKECIENKCNANYQCRWSGDCLARKFVCDGIKHCSDGDDEEGCDTWKCNKNEFRCGQSSASLCIPLNLKCDGHSDCFNGTDEENCSTECPNDKFLCKEGKCIPNIWKCDGMNDCLDGEDEKECGCEGLDQSPCAVGGCVPTFKLCDGLRHCPDGSDEWSCLKIDNATKQLQVRGSEGRWSSVCGDKWTSQWTDLVCEQLGFGVSLSLEVRRVEESSVPIPRVKLSPDAPEISRRGRAPLQYFFIHGDCPNDPLVHISCKIPQCGAWSLNAPNVILNEGKSTLDFWPSLGLLVQPETYVDQTMTYRYACSASVITPTWVLASYSCLASKTDGFHAEKWAFLIGEKSPKVGAEKTQLRYAKQVVVYPGAKRIDGLWMGDAVLLRLRIPLTIDSSTQPICLTDQPVAIHDHCVIATWNIDDGKKTDAFEKGKSQIIQTLPVPNLTKNTCNTSYYDGHLKKSHGCASFLQGKNSPCVGKEGSPLMCKRSSGTWYLQGLLSHVGNCANFNLPSIFTDVSYIESWVLRTIGRFPTEKSVEATANSSSNNEVLQETVNKQNETKPSNVTLISNSKATAAQNRSVLLSTENISRNISNSEKGDETPINR